MGAKKIAETTTDHALIREISRVITEVTGVQLGEKQEPLVLGRLSKRMRDLKIANALEYSRYYNANETIEVGILTSLLTTHHTFFFREFQQFEYLLNVSLPLIVKSHREKGLNTIRIWSAACSRGQEVYSLIMFLRIHLPKIAPGMDIEILGTDVCEESIAIARNGVFTWDELRTVPSIYLQGNWAKGSGEISQYVRAKEELRKVVTFKVMNLLDLEKNPFGAPGAKFDLIFCRNVFIYFNHQQIQTVAVEMMKNLNPVGHLFVGLSESLNGLGLPIEWVGPSVYEQKKIANPKLAAVKSKIDKPSAPPPISAGAFGEDRKLSGESQVKRPEVPLHALENTDLGSRKIKVLCVDDSPTVLLLLRRLLTPAKGFDVVGTAGDGLEAAEKIKLLKPDIVTLDIHMPKMTGVEFLEKHGRQLKVPVVIVSSVPRDDASLAYRCLELGASDYVEKPSTQNLEKVDEELIFKLRVAEESWRQANAGPTRSRALELDASFRRSPHIIEPEGKLRVVFASFASRDIVPVLLKGFQGSQPGTLVICDGAGDLFESFVAKLVPVTSGAKAGHPKSIHDLKPGTVFFSDIDHGAQFLSREAAQVITSCLAIGPLTRPMIQVLSRISVNQFVLEDRGAENPPSLMSKAHLVVPLTSFVYESNRFLAESGEK